jgi:hypothetical protein
MEAGLAVNKIPGRAVAVVATLFAGLAIGGSLGYTIKSPAAVTQSHPLSAPLSAPFTEPHDTQAVQSAPISDTCVFVDRHKGC